MGIMDLPARIKAARKAADLTQVKLAEAIGISQSAVTQWERGASQPTTDNLIDLARITSAPTHWLMFGGPLPEQDANGKFVPITHRGALVPEHTAVAAIAGVKPLPNARKVQAFYPCGSSSYYLSMSDNSNAPEHPAGAIWVMDPDVKPAPGSLVLAKRGKFEEPILGRLTFETTRDGVVTIVSPLNPAWPAARSDLEPLSVIARAVEAVRIL